MEEKNSKSIDCELDPITNSNSSPPNEVTALVSNPDPPNRCSLDSSKKFSFLKKHWQHLCASIKEAEVTTFLLCKNLFLMYIQKQKLSKNLVTAVFRFTWQQLLDTFVRFNSTASLLSLI